MRNQNNMIIQELRTGSLLSKNKELIDSLIQRACYGADLSDISTELLNHGIMAKNVQNIIRLIKWECKRIQYEAA